MTDTNQSKALTAEQIDCVLSDIATTAKQIDRMLSVLICGGSDQLPDDVMLVAMECMIQRIGWAADMAMMRSERSIGPCYGDATNWMMPPLFHERPAA